MICFSTRHCFATVFRQVLHYDTRSIAVNYLRLREHRVFQRTMKFHRRSWFFLDLLATVPALLPLEPQLGRKSEITRAFVTMLQCQILLWMPGCTCL